MYLKFYCFTINEEQSMNIIVLKFVININLKKLISFVSFEIKFFDNEPDLVLIYLCKNTYGY